jgi:hypothetical protein
MRLPFRPSKISTSPDSTRNGRCCGPGSAYHSDCEALATALLVGSAQQAGLLSDVQPPPRSSAATSPASPSAPSWFRSGWRVMPSALLRRRPRRPTRRPGRLVGPWLASSGRPGADQPRTSRPEPRLTAPPCSLVAADADCDDQDVTVGALRAGRRVRWAALRRRLGGARGASAGCTAGSATLVGSRTRISGCPATWCTCTASAHPVCGTPRTWAHASGWLSRSASGGLPE